MKKIHLLPLILVALVFVACQKEIDWSEPPAGGTNGDYLVKVIQVTPSTHDTNIITFDRDANKRVIKYQSAGKVNAISTDILHLISRAADGKVAKIKSTSTLTAGFLDSTVYFAFYTGSKLAYVIDTQYTLIGPIRDSMTYTYNASGQIIAKETYTEFFGVSSLASKQTYDYDGSGNVAKIVDLSPDGSGGFDTDATTTLTYDAHKTAVVLAEECFIVLGASNVSPFNCTKQVSNAVSSGTTYTTTFTNMVFNSFNRPSSGNLKVTPQPPGYDMKLAYYYAQ